MEDICYDDHGIAHNVELLCLTAFFPLLGRQAFLKHLTKSQKYKIILLQIRTQRVSHNDCEKFRAGTLIMPTYLPLQGHVGFFYIFLIILQ